MLIKRTSTMSGITREREIDVRQDQLDAWQRGLLTQDVMPTISRADREFIMTGIIQEEWDEMCKEIDE